MTTAVPRDQAAYRFSQICRNCKVPTDLVEDHAAGDLICKECGLVLESHSIEESSEWRSFSDSDKANRVDPNRVGGPANPLLSGGGLGTGMARPTDAASHALNRLHNRGADPDRALLASISQIGALCSKLQLPQVVTSGASEVFKNAGEKKALRGRSKQAVFAACVYIACRQESIERSFREICGAAEGTSVAEIGRAYTKIVSALDEVHRSMGNVAVQDEKMCARICASMGLPPEVGRAGREVARAARSLMELETAGLDATTRKTPMTIAAAAMWLACSLHGGTGKSLSDVSTASSMVEETIATAARWLFPHVRELVPNLASAFRREEAVARIEAAHPLRVTPAMRLAGLIDAAASARELLPPAGLGEAQRALVTAAAQSMGVQLQQADWLAAHNLPPQPLGRALAAALVWLALQLAGMTRVGIVQVGAAGGIAAPWELRAAAQHLFPHARALAAACASPHFRSDEELARIEAEHGRLLWLGDPATLAASTAAAAVDAALPQLAAAGRAAVQPPPRAFVSALGAAAAARVGDARMPEVPADGRSAAVAAAAALLALRLSGWRAPPAAAAWEGPQGAEGAAAAAAAHVDGMALGAAARLVFPHARALAAEAAAAAAGGEGMEGWVVSDAALSEVEAAFPPPAAPRALEEAAAAAPGAADGANSFWLVDDAF